MKPSLLLLMCCAPAAAHVISISNGYATIRGNRVDYLLRMPDYEVPKNADAAALLDRVTFSSGFRTAKRIDGECHRDIAGAVLLCAASYVFPTPPAAISVECTLFQATVPNHIHILRAERNGKTDQAILDSSFASAPLLFRPPTAFEQAASQAFAAAKRTLTTWVHLLLLIALVLASRSSRELLLSGLAFSLAQCAACFLLLKSAWQPPPGLTEAAVALALCYLAFEMLVFPKSGGRWLMAAVFGAFSGGYFASFIAEAGFKPAWVLIGTAGAFLTAVLLALPGYRFAVGRQTIARWSSVPLLSVGLVWFAVRLRNG